jgi:HEAT repeat protein
VAAQNSINIWAVQQKPIDMIGVALLLGVILALCVTGAYYAGEGLLWGLSPAPSYAAPLLDLAQRHGGWRTAIIVLVTIVATTRASVSGGALSGLAAVGLWAALIWGLALGAGGAAMQAAGFAPRGGWPLVMIPFGVGVAACAAVLVAIGLVIAWLVAARQHIEAYQKRSISEGAAALLLIVLLGGPPLAIWASGHMKGEEGGHIVPAIGIITVAGISLILIAAGWTDVLRRNAPRFRRVSQSFYSAGVLARVVGVVLNVASYVFSFIDWLFAILVSKASGATLGSVFARYAVLLAQLAACGAVLWFAHSAWALLASVWAFLITLGIARRWAWLEEDRERYLSVKQDQVSARSGIQIGFVDDLRDEALTSFTIFFFVLLPLTLRAANLHFPIFDIDADRLAAPGDYADWLGFLGGELAKAAPLIDWSEVYGVQNDSPIAPKDGLGQHIVFVLRAGMDVLLLSGLIQAFTISARLARERSQFDYPGDDLNRLDPFEERAELAAAAIDWDRAQTVSTYDASRLAQIFKDRTDASAIGAARLAGFQLADEALRTLMQARPRVGYPADLWSRLRGEALDGLRRRRDQIDSAARRSRFDPVIAFFESPPPENAVLTQVVGALSQLARMRYLENLILKVARAAPDIQREALDELKRCSPGDAADLIDMLKAPREELVIAAVEALGNLRTQIDRSIEHEASTAIAALMDQGQGYAGWQVRVAAAEALGKYGGDAALDALEKGMKDANSEVKRATQKALESIGGERAREILQDRTRRGRGTILDEIGDAARTIGGAPRT